MLVLGASGGFATKFSLDPASSAPPCGHAKAVMEESPIAYTVIALPNVGD
jgi:hypothetical protein